MLYNFFYTFAGLFIILFGFVSLCIESCILNQEVWIKSHKAMSFLWCLHITCIKYAHTQEKRDTSPCWHAQSLPRMQIMLTIRPPFTEIVNAIYFLYRVVRICILLCVRHWHSEKSVGSMHVLTNVMFVSVCRMGLVIASKCIKIHLHKHFLIDCLDIQPKPIRADLFCTIKYRNVMKITW